jgi:hypothetical protein
LAVRKADARIQIIKTITVRDYSKDREGAEHDQTMVYVRQ